MGTSNRRRRLAARSEVARVPGLAGREVRAAVAKAEEVAAAAAASDRLSHSRPRGPKCQGWAAYTGTWCWRRRRMSTHTRES